ncbi:MAG: hypothetical protein ACMXYK_02100 [Candidatus Woesearchaeota archaeon]
MIISIEDKAYDITEDAFMYLSNILLAHSTEHATLSVIADTIIIGYGSKHVLDAVLQDIQV